jgi:hypothetical protein
METITAADEGRHEPDGDQLWGESWYLDFAAPDGSIGGYVRLGLYPNLGVAWWWAYLVGPGRRPVLVRDHDVPLPKAPGLEIRTEGLWAELTCEVPHDHWSVGMEAFGVALDDPADAYHGERGERVAFGLDLEWEADAPVYPYDMTTRYEQSCHVHGDVLVGDERIAFDGIGERDHSWGVRDWWLFPWCWTAGHLADGTRFHAAGTTVDGVPVWSQGFTVPPDGELRPVEGYSYTTDTGREDLPERSSFAMGGVALEAEAVAHAPLLLVAPDGREGRFPRALCRFTRDDGVAGWGWTEWNQPPPPTA